MTADSQDVLTQALTNLQAELEQFHGLQEALKGAEQQLFEAEKEWRSLTAEQQRTTGELVRAVQSVAGQASALTTALIPLAKAVGSVNFPLRLDKIDMAVTTQSSALASFQSVVDRRFNELGRSEEDAVKAIAAVRGRIVRFGWVTAVLLLLNTAALVALGILLLISKCPLH